MSVRNIAVGIVVIGAFAGFEQIRKIMRPLPDPSRSEMSIETYRNICRKSDEDFMKNCKGRFVIFTGKVTRTKNDQGEIRVNVDGLGFDITMKEKPKEDILESLVMFSGRLSQNHTFNDDVYGGKILGYMANKQVLKAIEEFDRKEAQKKKIADLKNDPDTVRRLNSWGVSAEDYMIAKDTVSMAGTTCKSEAASAANYQSENVSWMKDNVDSWSMKNSDTISVSGSNLRMQNGFGAWKNVSYRCDYSIKNKSVTSISVE